MDGEGIDEKEELTWEKMEAKREDVGLDPEVRVP